ncbi:MAG: hypothetical protein ACAI35_25905 [Candidatus Methylacidiphilales bacterium]
MNITLDIKNEAVAVPVELPVGSSKNVEKTVRDWSDWVNPCVLLATRRSVRSYTFILALMSLQLSVISSLIMQFGAIPSISNPHYFTGAAFYAILALQLAGNTYIFWICTVPVFLLALPVPALWGLSYDISTRNTETMLMTRLTPFGLLCGVWLSKTLEAVLLASTLLPFAVIRYYLYGINPALDALGLACVVLVSSSFSAIAVALSTIRNILVRMLAALSIAACAIWILGQIMLNLTIMFFTPWGPVAALLGSCVIGQVIALGCAAMSVGPPTYNIAYIARFALIAMTGVWWLAAWANVTEFQMMSMQIMAGLPMFSAIMLEDVRHQQGVRPSVARIAADNAGLWAKLWLPGWQAGVWWVLAAVALWGMPLYVVFRSDGLSLFPIILGAAFFPFVCIRGFAMFLRMRHSELSEGRVLLAVTPVSGFIYVLGILFISFILSATMNQALGFKEAASFFFLNPAMQMASIWANNGTGYSSLQPLRSEPLLALISAWPAVAIMLLASWEYHHKVRKSSPVV